LVATSSRAGDDLLEREGWVVDKQDDQVGGRHLVGRAADDR
jgi:hypothetical protein